MKKIHPDLIFIGMFILTIANVFLVKFAVDSNVTIAEYIFVVLTGACATCALYNYALLFLPAVPLDTADLTEEELEMLKEDKK